eukprot:TRINITY_DN27582_c0_g3_i1.p1 TRINITY_DN27582_c0_g3~~TRINITY_DN27582_c0_g3_i1.p1  ORF type:complete len:101 (+),score=2.40 TRINITY_DN27582_c0_g3_i1:437-739(+)
MEISWNQRCQLIRNACSRKAARPIAIRIDYVSTLRMCSCSYSGAFYILICLYSHWTSHMFSSQFSAKVFASANSTTNIEEKYAINGLSSKRKNQCLIILP